MHGIFYRARGPTLRFELGGDGAVIDRFIQAYNRAQAIAALAFKGIGRVVAILGCYEIGNEGRTAVLRSARALGVTLPTDPETLILPAEEGLHRSLIAVELGVESLPRLLWGVLAAELGIRPGLRGDLYVATSPQTVLLHPYDDRAMDIIGVNKASLLPLYTAFNDWLLDFGRPQMDSVFLEP